ncbi:MAG: hypothetical protein LH660_10345 [Phormidesmis sp. CAN_BIN36]|nr:hypothetical protein [Phormidesmis sp. CAN_BIN36]
MRSPFQEPRVFGIAIVFSKLYADNQIGLWVDRCNTISPPLCPELPPIETPINLKLGQTTVEKVSVLGRWLKILFRS